MFFVEKQKEKKKTRVCPLVKAATGGLLSVQLTGEKKSGET